MSGDDLIGRIEAAVAAGQGHTIAEADLQRALTACVKAYAAKVEKDCSEFSPFDASGVNATEAVVAACAMIRAVNLNMFDVALWFGRPGPTR